MERRRNMVDEARARQLTEHAQMITLKSAEDRLKQKEVFDSDR